MRIRSLLVAIGLVPAFPLLAQIPTSDYDPEQDLIALLNTPVEVASKRQVTILTSPSVVSVLDRGTIERFGFLTLGEALETLPGMAVQRSIFHRDMPTIRGVLQESYANRVLILIDGVATWHTMTGDAFLFHVDIQDVERIEVLRGPASVLYGTNAYVGAVNVVTRKGAVSATSVHTDLQSRGGYRYGAGHLQLGQGWQLYTGAHSVLDREQNLTITGEDGKAFPFEGYNRTNNAVLRFDGGGHRLRGNAWRNVTPFFGATPLYASGGGRDWWEKGWYLNYGYRLEFGDKGWLDASATMDREWRIPVISQDNSKVLHQRGDRRFGTLQGAWNATSDLNLEFGATYEKRANDYYTIWNENTGQMVSDTGMLNRSQTESSAHLQASLGAWGWNFLAGSRYTRNSVFGNNVSSRVTAVHPFTDKNALKIIWGQSFRAPDFLAQFFLFSTTLGNEKLKPETAETFEVAYLHTTGGFYVQALAFHSRFRNKVNRVAYYPKYSQNPADSKKVIYDNVAPFSASGLELELKYEHAALGSLFLNADWIAGNKGDEDPTVGPGYNYKYVPKYNLSGGISRTWGGFTASLLANYTPSTDGALESVPAWTSVDLHAAYTHPIRGAKLRHTLTLKNAGDQERLFPEFVRRKVNALPEGVGRHAAYSLSVTF